MKRRDPSKMDFPEIDARLARLMQEADALVARLAEPPVLFAIPLGEVRAALDRYGAAVRTARAAEAATAAAFYDVFGRGAFVENFIAFALKREAKKRD